MKGIRTKDNKSLHIRGEIFLVLVDPLLTTRTQANPVEALRAVTYSEIYKFLSDLTFAEFVRVRHKLCDMDIYPDLVAYGHGCGFRVTRVVAVDYKKKKSTGKQIHMKDSEKEKGKAARKSADKDSDNEDSDYCSEDSDEDDWRQF
jgi:hypothetical protein